MRLELWFYSVRLWMRSVFRRSQVEQELDEELRYHVERRTEEGIAAGMSPEEASYAALRAMAGLEQRKQECRDTWGVDFIHDALRDLRYAVRMLRRAPGFTAVAVLSLSLGVGVNVAIFGVLNQALLRAATAREPERLVEVELGRMRQASFPDFLDLASSGLVGPAAAYTSGQESMSSGGISETVHSRIVTGNYFDLIGVGAALGRTFTEVDVSDDPQLVVLSHRFWELRMASDLRVIGQPMSLNGRPFTVLGVLARDFLPLTGPVEVPEIYVPVSPVSLNGLDNRRQPLVFPLVRLPHGMTYRQAETALGPLVARLDREYPEDEPRLSEPVRVVGVGAAARLMRHNPEAWLLCGAVLVLSGFVLFIACANVSSVLIVRGMARRREIAMRLAIGASRGRLVRQLVTETSVVALLASGAAFVLSAWTIGLINQALAHSREAVPFEVVPDARLLVYGLAVALLATLLAGLWPALQATRPALAPALKHDTAGSGRHPSRMRDALVIGEVAASFVLLTVAALFLRSLMLVSGVSPGFDVDNTVVATVNLPRDRYAGREQGFFEEAAARVRALPAVGAASVTALVPLSFTAAGGAAWLAGSAPETATHAYLNVVGPGYFHTLGIPVVVGREFGEGDREGAPAVAIVNQAFVRRQLADSSVLGRVLMLRDGDEPRPVTIVAVVGDARYLWPGEQPRAQLFLSAFQPQRIRRVRTLVARTLTPPASSLASLKRAIQGLEPLADVKVTTMRDHVSRAFWPSRIGAAVLGALGALGILLASVGLFGVLSYSVSNRRQEIGVRMALGATRARVLRMVLLSGLRIVGFGAGVGLPLSLAAPRPLAQFLSAGVAPNDALSLGVVCALMAFVGAAASIVPAWSASRLDPMQTLRCE